MKLLKCRKLQRNNIKQAGVLRPPDLVIRSEDKTMVKHIILWKLKDEYNNDKVKTGIKEGREGLLGVIPGLVEIKVQTEKLESSNVDVMLYSVFESADALRGYAVHPEHVKVADTKVRPFTATRACIDFEE